MTKNTVISCTMFAVLISAHCIMADTVSATSFRLQAMLLSDDAPVLLGSNLHPASFNTPSIIYLQTVISNVNFSSRPAQHISFISNQDAITNNITHFKTFTVGTFIPTENQYHSDIKSLGEVNFKLLGTVTENLGIFHSSDNSFDVKTEIRTVPKPEIYTILLTGLGLLGFTTRRRKHNA